MREPHEGPQRRGSGRCPGCEAAPPAKCHSPYPKRGYCTVPPPRTPLRARRPETHPDPARPAEPPPRRAGQARPSPPTRPPHSARHAGGTGEQRGAPASATRPKRGRSRGVSAAAPAWPRSLRARRRPEEREAPCPVR